MAKSRVTKIISGLLQKELIQIVDDPQDARIKLIILTQEGQRKSKELSAIITDLHKNLFLEFDPELRKTVLSCLDVLRSGMEAVKKQLA